MARKFADNKESGYFEIDPKHLAVGLAAARAKRRSAVRITALDYRDTDLGFDAVELARHTWIRRLSLDEDLVPRNFEALHELTGLTDLATSQWQPLDFSKLKKLKSLTLERGTALKGVEALPALRLLFLLDWRASTLPASVAAIKATEVILSASAKLTELSPVLEIPSLTKLSLTKLTKLTAPRAVRLDRLKVLHLEEIPKWTDFRNLSSRTLQELELFTKAESLAFLPQLPALRELYFWDVQDGSMAPILVHPRLREVYFEPHKRHYSHKEAELNALLNARVRAKKRRTA
ncbi:MAG: hypothetical protein R3B48_21630 [Kofleriaceae bacterium]